MLKFTTVNANGRFVDWSFSSIKALKDAYNSDDCDLPSGNDLVSELEFEGTKLCVDEFDDILRLFGFENVPDKVNNTLLWDVLKGHWGHEIEIALYGNKDGNKDEPASITLEDMDTNEVILDAGLYTLCERRDIERS